MLNGTRPRGRSARQVRREAVIAQYLGVVAAVDVLDRGALPRSGYKASRVVDS